MDNIVIFEWASLVALLWAFIVSYAAFYSMTKVNQNKKLIESNSKIINENRELITINQKLIGMINNFLSNSNMKVDWDRYSKDAKELGIVIDISPVHP